MAGKDDIPLSTFPDSVRDVLELFDTNKSGSVDPYELREAATMLKKAKAASDGSIAIAQLPKELYFALGAFDVDNDGTVAPAELAIAAKLYSEFKNTVKRLTKVVIGLVVVLAIMLAAIGGLTSWVVESSKETKTSAEGITMVAGTKTPAAMGSVVEENSLDEMFNATADILNAVDNLNIVSDTGDEYGFTVTKWVRSSTYLTFFNAAGDTVVVSATGYVAAFLPDGTPILLYGTNNRHLSAPGGLNHHSCSWSVRRRWRSNYFHQSSPPSPPLYYGPPTPM